MQMTPHRLSAVLLVLGAVLFGGAALLEGAPHAVRASAAQEAVDRDPAVQSALRRVLDANAPAERRAALDALRDLAGPRNARLVRQLLLFAEGSKTTREGMLFGVVLAELDVPRDDVVDALAPLLEDAETDRRASIAGVLAAYEGKTLVRGADFTLYRARLAGPGGPPPGLVRHLYETDADAALLAVTRARAEDPAELRALLWAWHELADLRWKLRLRYLDPDDLPGAADPEALGQLGALATNEHWWARLAAARTALEHPALRGSVPLADLARDEHPLVREWALEAQR